MNCKSCYKSLIDNKKNFFIPFFMHLKMKQNKLELFDLLDNWPREGDLMKGDNQYLRRI